MANLTAVPTGYALDSDAPPWTWIATENEVPVDRGVAGLADGVPVAIFRLSPIGSLPEAWHAVSHLDPVTSAPVMARGLVGSRQIDGETVATIASPLHKRRYDLASGRCLDDDSPPLTVFKVLVIDGQVLVR